jgi:arsenate reductase
VTVCDDARQVCPVFPGAHASLHWSLEDPAAVVGTDEERMAAFRTVAASLSDRIDAFLTVARP